MHLMPSCSSDRQFLLFIPDLAQKRKHGGHDTGSKIFDGGIPRDTADGFAVVHSFSSLTASCVEENSDADPDSRNEHESSGL